MKRWWPVGSFSLFIVSFFLPFVVLTCSGRPIEKELSGVDLLLQTYNHDESGELNSNQEKDKWIQFIVGIAITSGIVGLGISITSFKNKYLWQSAAGFVAVVFLSILYLYLKNKVIKYGSTQQSFIFLEMKFRPGYWLALFLSIYHGVFYSTKYISERKSFKNKDSELDWPK